MEARAKRVKPGVEGGTTSTSHLGGPGNRESGNQPKRKRVEINEKESSSEGSPQKKKKK